MKEKEITSPIITIPELPNGDEYRIICEPLSFVLQKKVYVKRKTGDSELDWTLTGYFGSVKTALQRILKDLGPNTDTTIEEYIKLFQECCNTLKEVNDSK